MKRIKFLTCILIAMAILFVIFSDIVLSGAKNGVLLWYNSLLPLLLPTMFISSSLVSCGAKCSILLCFLCGYPTGAFIISQMEKKRNISKDCANRLLPICNNLSPMFMQNYIGITCLKLNQPYIVITIVFLACGIYYLITELFQIKTAEKDESSNPLSGKNNTLPIKKSTLPDKNNPSPHETIENINIFEIINTAMTSSVSAILKVLVVVIFFSILCEFLIRIDFIQNEIKLIILIASEITTGAKAVSGSNIFGSLTMPVTIAFSAFGGLSAMVQTFSVAEDNYDIKKYIYGKALIGIIAFVLSCLTVYVLKIH